MLIFLSFCVDLLLNPLQRADMNNEGEARVNYRFIEIERE